MACDPDDSGAPDSGPNDERCSFSFAILTDTHIGEGTGDYGTAGWDDGYDDQVESDSEAVLAQAVTDINTLAEAPDGPSFALILGDITDSGERSELERADILLGQLTLPWLPLLGNHDTWPYAYDASASTYAEAETPTGDALLYETFAQRFEVFEATHPTAVHAEPAWDPAIGTERPFVNFAFTHCGVRFVAIDTNTRTPAEGEPPGIGPEAALHTMDGGPWPWLLDDLTQGAGGSAETVVVLAHHPFTQSTMLAFDEEDFATIEADLQAHGVEDRIAAFFGGHLHLDSEQSGPTGIPVVLTAATKDGHGPRVVQVSELGKLDWD